MEPVLGPHARTDRTRNTQVAVPWLPAPEDGRSGEGQRLTPDAPHNSGRQPPPGDGPHHPRGTQPPQGVQAKPGREEPELDRPPPSTPDGARDRGRTRRGAPTTWNGPTSAQCRDRARCARHTTQGGGSGRRGSASAHTRKGHAGTTRRAIGPSSRNAQTAWNGVTASEGKGHPDRMARHTQRGTRGAGRGTRERHNTRYRPEPPEPVVIAAHTRTGHCTRQGSSGALRHAPTPRQGSLRASSRGSHWRQASSTGPLRRRPGRPRIRGVTRWVSARSHSCKLMHLPGSGETGKPGRDGAPSPVNPGDSATRQEMRLGGPPTRTRWGGYHLARPGGPRGRKASSTRKIKPQISAHRPFKLWFEFEVHLDQVFARQGWGQRSKILLVFLDELTETVV